MGDFKDGVVGAKSKNLASLRGKLPDWIKLPPAVTVPFSSFEQVCGGGGGTWEGRGEREAGVTEMLSEAATVGYV